MATQTQTTTTTTTRGGRSSLPPSSSTTTAPAVDLVQQIQTAFNAAFSRSRGEGGGTPGGNPPAGEGGPGAPGPPGSGGALQNPAAPSAQVPVPVAADVCTMGTIPHTFTGKRDEAKDWLDKL